MISSWIGKETVKEKGGKEKSSVQGQGNSSQPVPSSLATQWGWWLFLHWGDVPPDAKPSSATLNCVCGWRAARGRWPMAAGLPAAKEVLPRTRENWRVTWNKPKEASGGWTSQLTTKCFVHLDSFCMWSSRIVQSSSSISGSSSKMGNNQQRKNISQNRENYFYKSRNMLLPLKMNKNKSSNFPLC